MDLELLLVESRRVADALLAAESAIAGSQLLLATDELKPDERAAIEAGLASCQRAMERLSKRMVELDTSMAALR